MIRLFRRPSRDTLATLGVAGMFALTIGASLYLTGAGQASEPAVVIPPPAVESTAPVEGLETAIFAGGCFWGVQGVFQHVEGVESAISGYAGGPNANPSYKEVTTGMTGHAESVEVKFDPKKVSYGKLLQVFFSVAHNPTQLNYQGPDVGTQYRSAIFYTNDEQKRVAEAYVQQLDAAKLFSDKIVTELSAAPAFYPAEDYHQDYATLHPDQPYIAYNDLPKIANLKALFPDIWRETPKLVFAANAS
jgi:peptide-methionine (S)-S-oxide reductase